LHVGLLEEQSATVGFSEFADRQHEGCIVARACGKSTIRGKVSQDCPTEIRSPLQDHTIGESRRSTRRSRYFHSR